MFKQIEKVHKSHIPDPNAAVMKFFEQAGREDESTECDSLMDLSLGMDYNKKDPTVI